MTEHVVAGVRVSDRNWPEWQHRYTASKPYPKGHVVVEAGLHYLRGNRQPYFSVTATQYEGQRDVAGGCMHDLVLYLWPELKPIVDLHLSDMDGTPMHDVANGWYQLAGYYGGAGERYHAGNSERQHWKPGKEGVPEWDGYRLSTPEECLWSFARHVRISDAEALALADQWQRGIPYDEVKPLYVAWVEQQRERWKAEAQAAIELLDRLNEGRKEKQCRDCDSPAIPGGMFCRSCAGRPGRRY